ncbi:PIN domain-containing protein [Kribbella sp. NPDC051770]|uniref:PIN domain-containing protein n=1 Tax=Kribbella sp. NPDC051770 TaxID=3155413 RepID=UPI003447B214
MADASKRAFLDANVLRGSLQTDVLLTLAFREEFQPRWNAEVLDEVRRNRPPKLSEAAMDKRLAQMNEAFPQALVEGYEHLEPDMQADPKDKHVLAAAVASESTVLVTENVKDFNPPTTGPHAMPVQRLSKFLSDLTRENPARMVAAMREMIGRNERDPNTLPALIDRMAKLQDLKGFAQALNAEVPENERGTTLPPPQQVAAQQQVEAAVDPELAATNAVAFDGVPGAGTKAPDRQGTEQKAQTAARTPETPERER